MGLNFLIKPSNFILMKNCREHLKLFFWLISTSHYKHGKNYFIYTQQCVELLHFTNQN